MEKVNINLATYIFNFLELTSIVILGIINKISIEIIVALMIIFIFVMQNNGKQMHYKSPILCFFSTLLIFVFLYKLANLSEVISLCVSAIAGYTFTGNADVKQVYLYNGTSKYKEMKQYVKEHKESKELKDFEKILMKFNDIYNDRYKFDFLELYRLEFLEDLKYKEILDNTNLKDNRQITDALDIITISLNTFIETKNVEKNKLKYFRKLRKKQSDIK